MSNVDLWSVRSRRRGFAIPDPPILNGMNLANLAIILAFYSTADPRRRPVTPPVNDCIEVEIPQPVRCQTECSRVHSSPVHLERGLILLASVPECPPPSPGSALHSLSIAYALLSDAGVACGRRVPGKHAFLPLPCQCCESACDRNTPVFRLPRHRLRAYVMTVTPPIF